MADDKLPRLGQTVCRVNWRKGFPFIETGKVWKRTKRRYYVQIGKKQNKISYATMDDWAANYKKAIVNELRDLLSSQGAFERDLERWKDYNVGEIVLMVIRVYRLNRRIFESKERAKKKVTECQNYQKTP